MNSPRCSMVKCAAKSSVTWLGSPPGREAQMGQTYNSSSILVHTFSDAQVTKQISYKILGSFLEILYKSRTIIGDCWGFSRTTETILSII